jgi:hypothetical protein
LTANSAIKTAFGASPVFFGVSELGGACSSVATSQTVTSYSTETVNLAELASRENLVAGFYDGATVGTGVTSVSFTLYVDGVDVAGFSGDTAAQATTFFTDNAMNLGSLASGSTLVGTNNNMTVEAVLSITSDAASSGFYGGVVVGDPPPVSVATAHNLASAMAGFGPNSGAPTSSAFMAHLASASSAMLARPVATA